MKFFIDTANIDEIKEANALGVLAGVTTNPSLVAKENVSFSRSFKRNHSRSDKRFGKCGSCFRRC